MNWPWQVSRFDEFPTREELSLSNGKTTLGELKKKGMSLISTPSGSLQVVHDRWAKARFNLLGKSIIDSVLSGEEFDLDSKKSSGLVKSACRRYLLVRLSAYLLLALLCFITTLICFVAASHLAAEYLHTKNKTGVFFFVAALPACVLAMTVSSLVWKKVCRGRDLIDDTLDSHFENAFQWGCAPLPMLAAGWICFDNVVHASRATNLGAVLGYAGISILALTVASFYSTQKLRKDETMSQLIRQIMLLGWSSRNEVEDAGGDKKTTERVTREAVQHVESEVSQIFDARKNDPAVRLQKVKRMFEEGLIAKEEFDGKKKQILAEM